MMMTGKILGITKKKLFNIQIVKISLTTAFIII